MQLWDDFQESKDGCLVVLEFDPSGHSHRSSRAQQNTVPLFDLWSFFSLL